MVMGHFGPQASLVHVEWLGLCMGGRRSDRVLINGSALNVLSLENLGLPGLWLSIVWDRW
jgi:hypothetical protein